MGCPKEVAEFGQPSATASMAELTENKQKHNYSRRGEREAGWEMAAQGCKVLVKQEVTVLYNRKPCIVCFENG